MFAATVVSAVLLTFVGGLNAAASPTQNLPPVMYFAPFLSGGGYCSEATSFLKTMAAAGAPVQIIQHGDSINAEFLNGLHREEAELVARHMQSVHLDPSVSVAICHSEPGAWHPPKWPTSRCPPPDALYSIGRTMFETADVPPGWIARLKAMDEIWVPSTFNVETFTQAGVPADKLVVVPEPVDTEFFSPARGTERPFVYNNTKSYRFLSVGKWEARKGWDILLRAYLTEFGPTEDVCLVIHTQPYHSDRPITEAIAATIREVLGMDPAGNATLPALPCIEVISAHVPDDLMPGLYSGAQCLVQPSHGEGWGRPHVEAMSMGLPVIATNWSGTTAFLTPANGYPLSIEGLQPVGGTGSFRAHRWAQPSGGHLRTLMREVFTDRAGASARGEQARRDMVARYSVPVVGEVVTGHLERIARKVASTHDQHTDL
ncbi:putative glycosyltransferase; CAZy family GT4 [Paratrimastix pyriformis]|uniref:Glycosyltransferase n=1 Tax=Paratrimastix pyriformis TaxID=342808 RepID=A0ABQ8UEB7_9EUKA|nr:putative glycosyltransferase; CAZy family GT4 [Paratrimastix pyriformis]